VNRRNENPYMVVETFDDGTRLRKTSGSFEVCCHAALEMRQAGFNADVFVFREGLDQLGPGLLGPVKKGGASKKTQ
jgi:hypothetical protein